MCEAPVTAPSAGRTALNRLPRIVRFLLAGGLNTALSYGVYLALLALLGYRWAYVVSYVFGIALSYALLRWVVFRQPGRQHAWAMVAGMQLGQFWLGLGVVELWVRAGLPKEMAALVSVAVCLPLVYAVNRWVFRANRQRVA